MTEEMIGCDGCRHPCFPDKTMTCWRCRQTFCLICWQHGGIVTDNFFGCTYTCADCDGVVPYKKKRLH